MTTARYANGIATTCTACGEYNANTLYVTRMEKLVGAATAGMDAWLCGDCTINYVVSLGTLEQYAWVGGTSYGYTYTELDSTATTTNTLVLKTPGIAAKCASCGADPGTNRVVYCRSCENEHDCSDNCLSEHVDEDHDCNSGLDHVDDDAAYICDDPGCFDPVDKAYCPAHTPKPETKFVSTSTTDGYVTDDSGKEVFSVKLA